MYALLLIGAILGAPLASAALPHQCGTRWLAEQAGNRPLPTAGKAAKALQSEEIAVGTTLATALFGDAFLRSTTCRYVGDNAYIFVEDRVWDVVVVQPSIDRLGALFDEATPADPARGIYELATEAFGEAPDVDGDKRIFIFVVDMPDNRIVGFFDPRIATHIDPQLRRDALFLDAFHLNSNPTLARGTLAHEFQHLIHWGHDDDEEAWVDEGLSGYAEELVGFAETDPNMVPQFLDAPDLNLTTWPSVVGAAIPHYGATYLFASFLRERYGPELIRALVAEGRNGTFGIDEAFKDVGAVENFVGAWRLWIAGNYASGDTYYGYRALRGRRVRSFAIDQMPFGPAEGGVGQQWGTINFSLHTPGNVEVEFRGAAEGRYAVWGYGLRGRTGEMVAVELDDNNAGSVQWAGVDSIGFVVGRTALAGGSFSLAVRPYEPEPIPTAVGEVGQADVHFALGAAYPNPFNGQVLLPVEVARHAMVEISIYNSLGQRVRRLVRGPMDAGSHRQHWDGRDDMGRAVGSGQYYAIAHIGEAVFVRGLTLVK